MDQHDASDGGNAIPNDNELDNVNASPVKPDDRAKSPYQALVTKGKKLFSKKENDSATVSSNRFGGAQIVSGRGPFMPMMPQPPADWDELNHGVEGVAEGADGELLTTFIFVTGLSHNLWTGVGIDWESDDPRVNASRLLVYIFNVSSRYGPSPIPSHSLLPITR